MCSVASVELHKSSPQPEMEVLRPILTLKSLNLTVFKQLISTQIGNSS